MVTIRRSPVARSLVVAVCALAPALGSGQPAVDPRSEMEAFAAALDAAVRRVSRPSPIAFVGRDSARAYRLAGFGALFVLPPRALPSDERSPLEREAARSLDEAIRHLQEGLKTTSSPEIRRQMEANLVALKQTLAGLRRTPRERAATVMMLPDGLVIDDAEETGEIRLQELQAELEMRMAEQMRALQAAERTHGEQEQKIARQMRTQVRELQARMEAVRRDVERARVAAERQVEMRLAAPPEPPTVPRAPVELAPAPQPVSEPPSEPAPPAFAVAPWQFWFNVEDPGDGRTAEAVVRDVKAAVASLLERQGGALRHLKPDEYVAVAVDFVPGVSLLGGRTQKTIVIRARKRDLDERRAGRLGATELRQRIEYSEY
jgi:uncharacterized coiled-coil protein SlyX